MDCKSVFFDLDGTLTDSSKGIFNSFIYALQKLGEPIPPRSEMNKLIGPPLIYSFTEFFGFSEERAELAVRTFREYYRERGILENRLYPGIKQLLASLKDAGKTIVLATSKHEPSAERVLEYFDIAGYFSHISGSHQNSLNPSKEAIIARALELSGFPAEEAIMVGDREFDILGAKKLGIPTIGVLYGFGTRTELAAAGADYIVETTTQLLRQLTSSRT